MRRVGGLFDAVVERENLLLAFWKASRGKSARPDRQAYAANLEAETEALRAGLLDGSYPVGNYSQFTIFDPKERIITAAPFRERVLQHALMNVCEPFFDKWLVSDSYASRRGKGQLAAVEKASVLAGRFEWFLKCDIRKFFDSVPHDLLRAALRRKFKDLRLLGWFDRIIATYEMSPGRGLPIGNLTSQHFANFYLDPLDRTAADLGGVDHAFASQQRGGRLQTAGAPSTTRSGFVRYMDDFVFWSDDRLFLLGVRDRIGKFVRDALGLELKGGPFLNRTRLGMDFLGYRIFPRRKILSRSSRDRYRRNLRRLERWRRDGIVSCREFQRRADAIGAFAAHADCLTWRRNLHERIFA